MHSGIREYMAKAHITTPEGVKITIDGTPKEIAAVVEDIKAKATSAEPARRKAK
jgi:hypothetical protein